MFVAAFRFLGNRTGVTEKYDLIHNISKYVSSSLIGLDIFLKNGSSSISTSNGTFAPHLLNRVYEFLNNVGFNIQTLPHHDEFFSFKGSTSNIYTGLKHYVLDFGYSGALFVLFIVSIMITLLLEQLKKPNKGFSFIVMVGSILYPMIMIAISDVVPDLLNIGTLYMLIYLLILEFLVLPNYTIDYERTKI